MLEVVIDMFNALKKSKGFDMADPQLVQTLIEAKPHIAAIFANALGAEDL